MEAAECSHETPLRLEGDGTPPPMAEAALAQLKLSRRGLLAATLSAVYGAPRGKLRVSSTLIGKYEDDPVTAACFWILELVLSTRHSQIRGC